ncbi:MAG TPA: cellulase family glycosylhydrolase [Phycisphaerae bacterium]|nr:cellulase family glycosylhydrolase [Phycisphaerae bacterium]HRY67946.1 cellulase family glycosylhydrolase [Phycisphaerae bacterium]HSA26683.1 cellulase family glycosylhydrolase [Phycisphaerae bacterium]
MFENCFSTVAIGVCLGSVALAVEQPFVEVDRERTTSLRERGTGRPIVVVGVNYFSPDIGWAPKLWQRFDETAIRHQLKMLHEQGYNAIRVFLTFESFHREPGKVHPEGERKFGRLLALCRDLGLYVIPSGPDHWEGTPSWRQGGDVFADDRILAADESWWKEFAHCFKDEPAILAWDLLNEPAVAWKTSAMAVKWNAWLKAEYGSVERLAAKWGREAETLGGFGGVETPPREPALGDVRLFDYQRFRESIGDEWTRRLTTAIRSVDSHHLITIGHIQWAAVVYLPTVWHYAGFEPKANARHLDFMTVHFYPLAGPHPGAAPEGLAVNASYLEAVLHEFTVGKPLMLGEFAWYGGGAIMANGKEVMPTRTLEDQVAWGRKLLDVTRGRLCGWLHWAFADTPTSSDLTRWSGLWTEQLELKPWGEVYGRFAREHCSRPEVPRPFPSFLTRFEFDRKAMLTDPGAGEAVRLALLKAAASQPAAGR